MHPMNIVAKEDSERETIVVDGLEWFGCGGGGFTADGAGAGHGQAG